MITDPKEFLETIDPASFSYREILGRDVWTKFTPAFGSLTVVGTLSATGRLKSIGRLCLFQIQFAGSTSIASVAGTDYLTLPIPAIGLDGIATMTNATTNVAVGACSFGAGGNIGKCFLPAQVASGNGFKIAGWYEI